ncbi:hypothetical protein ALQ21_102285 [Pseudomonas savastanoi pv. glycinea]|nr:hypothetical protein ALQ21_102285 [Pseudomonas savastanoi pv. glycinea]
MTDWLVGWLECVPVGATGAAIRIVRERAGTSAEDVSSGIKPSRTSSLPQGVRVISKDFGRSQIWMRSGGEGQMLDWNAYPWSDRGGDPHCSRRGRYIH